MNSIKNTEHTAEEISMILKRGSEKRKKEWRNSFSKKLFLGTLYLILFIIVILALILSVEIYRNEKPFWFWQANLLEHGILDGVLIIFVYLALYFLQFILFYPICWLIQIVNGNKKLNKVKVWSISIFYGTISILFNNQIRLILHDIFDNEWYGILKFSIFGIALFFTITILLTEKK